MGGERIFGLLLVGLAIAGIYLYDSPNRSRIKSAWLELTAGPIVQSSTSTSNAPDFGPGSATAGPAQPAQPAAGH